jgi:hypothetical protein
MMAEHGIPEPIVTITDRDIAFMKFFEKFFSIVAYLLCHWYIGKNVQAKY